MTTERRIKMTNIILFILYVILSSSGLILFKLGSLNPNININVFNFALSFSIKSIIGMLCYGISFLLWMVIVSRMNLTIAMPLSVALVNTLVLFGSCIFLHEKVSITQGIGVFIVILGVSLIGIKK